MSDTRIATLLEKLLANTCSLQEKKELFTLIENVDDPQLKAVLEQAWHQYDQPSHTLPEAASRAILHNILHQQRTVKIIPVMRKWRMAAVAATGALVIGLSTYKLFLSSPSAKKEIVATVAHNDVKAPIITRATITLANGQQVSPDSIANGQLAVQGQTQVVKLPNGNIVYQSANNTGTKLIYNTLTNPRGSQVATMTLSDGTKVWLNAGSALTYPVAFSGKERRVTIKGEAYFEVAPAGDHKIPFFVNIRTNQRDSGQVVVLGTHFNIKAYEDETDTRITLLQGSVQVDHQQQSTRIVPGQQATYTESPQIRVNNADAEQVVAWKEGLFAYSSSSVAQVLRDAARWYDIDVVYAGAMPEDTFTGEIPRTATLTELLDILKMSRVHFKLEDRKLIVLN